MHLIYEFDDPRDNSVIYIGLTNNLERRVKEHVKRGLLYPLAQELRALGLALSLSVIDSASDQQDGRHLEKKWIQKKKPLLNYAHNMRAVYEREEEEEHLQRVRECMDERELTYKEAVIFVKHFCKSEGDYYNYTIISGTAQLTRKRLGLEPLAESEVLDIALELCNAEQYRIEVRSRDER
jgi:predicted GIY-YIG superfamily endonuclease